MDRSLKKRKTEPVEDFETKMKQKILLVSSSAHDQQVCQAISETLQGQNVTVEVTEDFQDQQNVLCVISLNSNSEVSIVFQNYRQILCFVYK